jgi:hypothetical protein
MSTPGSLRIERPYASKDAYLEGDAWTVDRTDMLLVGAEDLAQGTSVKFEIVLANGDAVVRGEGRVVETVGANGGRPGGLRVRFRQLDSDSKAMLRRALEVQKRGAASARVEPLLVAPVADAAPTTSTTAPERSGVRHRAFGAIVAPGNRDTLLARLRERAPRVASNEPKRRTAAE